MLTSSFWTTHCLPVNFASNLTFQSLLMTSFKVDAHVGKSLFHDAILGALRKQGKTVILVTHALHFLSYCDYIYTLREGRLAEQGTFQELVAANGEFSRLDKEYGGNDSQPTEKSQVTMAVAEDVKAKLLSGRKHAVGTGKIEGKLIVKEQRTTGSIPRQGNSMFSLIPNDSLTFISLQGLYPSREGIFHDSPYIACRCFDARKPNHQFIHFGVVGGEVGTLSI
jgi:hypothetical protein